MFFTLLVIRWLQQNKKMADAFLNTFLRHVYLEQGHLAANK